VEPGKYQYALQACRKDSAGIPECGAQTKPITVTVTEEILEKYDTTEPPADEMVPDSGESQAVIGGPDEFRPGMWADPNKIGQGWSFYWANRLALSQNPSNAYDLYAIWYTFEAKTKINGSAEPGFPPVPDEYTQYRPIVATSTLVLEANNKYQGSLRIKRLGQNPTLWWVGSVTVNFGSGSGSPASIVWTNVNFKRQLLSGVDNVNYIVGHTNVQPADSDISHYAGLWGNTDASYFIVDNVGSYSEAIQAIFYDDAGDPTWIQAEHGTVPQAGEISLCFYHIPGGFQPDLTQTTIPAARYTNGCDPLNATFSNRNGKRVFNTSETASYWVNFTLPAGTGGNSPSGGSVSIGTSSSPATLTKAANFHRIWSNSGSSCEVTVATPSCTINLTWFTDSDYPQATAYSYNSTTGQRTAIATSTDPAMLNVPATLSAVGTYTFELRMKASTTSALIAQSSPFTVTQGAVASPTNLVASWTNQANRQYSVLWNHATPSGISHYELHETQPGGSTNTVTISPGTTLSKAYSRAAGPFGTYSYKVRACTSTQCSAYTSSINWAVTDPGTPVAASRPWSENQYGPLTTDRVYHYAMGYHFRPEVNGDITELGGFFNGVKTVKLFNRSTGALLAQATVSSNNAWSFVPITPVAVTAGTEYTVAAYIAGNGASFRASISMPVTYGSIRILSSTYTPTDVNPNAIPINELSSTMFGQADIGFVAGGVATPQPPTISPIANQQHPEGGSVSLQVSASDSDGTITGYSASGLPTGLSINSTGLISGTIALGAAGASPYNVTVTVTDSQSLTAQRTFTWTVTPPTAGSTFTAFYDSFELSTWNNLWTQDSQNDWLLSTQRATAGTKSAEVDGLATDAQLISIPIDLQAANKATIEFDWLIESSLIAGEYIAFDASIDGGNTWVEHKRLRADVDQENTWISEQAIVSNISSLRLRFRGKMSSSTKDANVDNVKVTATIPAGNRVDVFLDDFEINRSWVRNQQGSDTATLGLWERGNPLGTTYEGNTYQLDATTSGSNSLVTDRRGGTTEYDVDGGVTSISSPNITLPAGGADYRLNFNYNFAYASSAASLDRFAVYVVSGGTETKVHEEIDANNVQPGAWRSLQLNLSAFAGQSIRIKFVADDDTATGVLVEAQVDDVQVSYFQPSPNTPPVIANPGNQSHVQGTTINDFVIGVNDAESDQISCSFSGLPSGLAGSVNSNQDCQVDGSISAGPGTFAVTVTANDGNANSSPVNFNWTVTATPTNGVEDIPDDQLTNIVARSTAHNATVGAVAGSPNVSGGQAVYTIPITVSLGRQGMQPELSLSYSSRGGNGVAGMGWSITGLSSISRCPATMAQDGFTRGISISDTDRLCLDGQRLIKVSAGGYWANGAEYRTEVDSFARIKLNGSGGATSTSLSFTVESKDGLIRTYAYSANAKSDSGSSRTLSWLLTEEKDRAGNTIHYTYSDHAPGSAGDHQINTIAYTGLNSTSGNRKVSFGYDTRCIGSDCDRNVAYTAGYKNIQTARLSSITTCISAGSCSATGFARRYVLNHSISSATGRMILDSITEQGWNEATGQAFSLPPTTFVWSDEPPQFSSPEVFSRNVGGIETPITNVCDYLPRSTPLVHQPEECVEGAPPTG
jgi:hypothetical protein